MSLQISNWCSHPARGPFGVCGWGRWDTGSSCSAAWEPLGQDEDQVPPWVPGSRVNTARLPWGAGAQTQRLAMQRSSQGEAASGWCPCVMAGVWPSPSERDSPSMTTHLYLLEALILGLCSDVSVFGWTLSASRYLHTASPSTQTSVTSVCSTPQPV